MADAGENRWTLNSPGLCGQAVSCPTDIQQWPETKGLSSRLLRYPEAEDIDQREIYDVHARRQITVRYLPDLDLSFMCFVAPQNCVIFVCMP